MNKGYKRVVAIDFGTKFIKIAVALAGRI